MPPHSCFLLSQHRVLMMLSPIYSANPVYTMRLVQTSSSVFLGLVAVASAGVALVVLGLLAGVLGFSCGVASPVLGGVLSTAPRAAPPWSIFPPANGLLSSAEDPSLLLCAIYHCFLHVTKSHCIVLIVRLASDHQSMYSVCLSLT